MLKSSVTFQNKEYFYTHKGLQVLSIEDSNGSLVSNPLIFTVCTMDVKLYFKDSYMEPDVDYLEDSVYV